MRKTRNQQLPLVEGTADHPKAKELFEIGKMLDCKNSIYDMVLQDLATSSQNNVGANGMTAEQIVRAAIVQKIGTYSYRELAFHLADSRAYRQFCKLGMKKPFEKSALQKGIKAISKESWELMNRIVIGYAGEKAIEKGRKIRVDCTVVESNIHAPYDSELLVDANRVLARLLAEAKSKLPGIIFSYTDHRRRAKRRCLDIMNAKNAVRREKPYKDLIAITKKTIDYSENGLKSLASYKAVTLEEHALKAWIVKQLQSYLPLAHQVVCQTWRRVIAGESVPAQEKIVSIFEPHTDIIRKDRRDTYYGHKICLTGGASNLILDCIILEGNPADSELTAMMLDRQKRLYHQYPIKVAFDGGFASHANLREAKDNGIKDVCFSKGRGLSEQDMCRSKGVYKKLRKFRAGIESGISWLKRSLGLNRCTWKGLESFNSYVWSSIFTANLLTLARKQML
jgi:transposase, IS5 family